MIETNKLAEAFRNSLHGLSWFRGANGSNGRIKIMVAAGESNNEMLVSIIENNRLLGGPPIDVAEEE